MATTATARAESLAVVADCCKLELGVPACLSRSSDRQSIGTLEPELVVSKMNALDVLLCASFSKTTIRGGRLTSQLEPQSTNQFLSQLEEQSGQRSAAPTMGGSTGSSSSCPQLEVSLRLCFAITVHGIEREDCSCRKTRQRIAESYSIRGRLTKARRGGCHCPQASRGRI